ncbi:segregation/condensation protein A [Streptomyces sp. NPDC007988]|uniref:segregation/condensation protein A n=1 Tax=Streptomyces sp. NPDC007988 TaxID=3364802 RepID=UPI0036E25A4E
MPAPPLPDPQLAPQFPAPQFPAPQFPGRVPASPDGPDGVPASTAVPGRVPPAPAVDPDAVDHDGTDRGSVPGGSGEATRTGEAPPPRAGGPSGATDVSGGVEEASARTGRAAERDADASERTEGPEGPEQSEREERPERASGPGAPVPAAAPADGGQVPAPVAEAHPPAPVAVAGEAAEPVDDGRFTVRLANFEGPFDLLLQLISKHKLDVTEVALSKVTDEFMAHIRAMGPDWDLDQTTEFLVVAATLLDLKAARLLPAAEVEDEADLALLEARDLLFARLLQYRAYKQVAEIFSNRLDEESRRYPRTVGLEDHHAELLPDVVISIGPEGFARLAVKAMQPKPKPQVYVDHIHAPLVSVREQAEVVVGLLRERGRASFRELTDGVTDTLTVVARFLALLELYREKAVVLDQEDALGELVVTWAGGEADAHVTDEFDRAPESMEEKA